MLLDDAQQDEPSSACRRENVIAADPQSINLTRQTGSDPGLRVFVYAAKHGAIRPAI